MIVPCRCILAANQSRFFPAVCLQPFKQPLYTGCGQCDACIGSAIIKMNGIAVSRKSVAAGEDDVVHIPASRVTCFDFIDRECNARGAFAPICDGLPHICCKRGDTALPRFLSARRGAWARNDEDDLAGL
jgi:hypothetical protein